LQDNLKECTTIGCIAFGACYLSRARCKWFAVVS